MRNKHIGLGKLDRRIRIQKKVVYQDEYGEEVRGYEDVMQAWANVAEKHGGESMESNQLTATSNVVFTIHYSYGVDETMRIIYLGKFYDIKGIKEIGRRQRLEILAQIKDSQNE